MRTERVNLRITKELYDKLMALAKKEHRSFSNYIEMVLIKYVKGE